MKERFSKKAVNDLSFLDELYSRKDRVAMNEILGDMKVDTEDYLDTVTAIKYKLLASPYYRLVGIEQMQFVNSMIGVNQCAIKAIRDSLNDNNEKKKIRMSDAKTQKAKDVLRNSTKLYGREGTTRKPFNWVKLVKRVFG